MTLNVNADVRLCPYYFYPHYYVLMFTNTLFLFNIWSRLNFFLTFFFVNAATSRGRDVAQGFIIKKQNP